MLQWRAENSSLVLESEVDALSQDADGFTPLVCIINCSPALIDVNQFAVCAFQMRACSKGWLDTVLVLYEWNHDSLKVLNNNAQSAMDCAREARHPAILEEIEKLEASRGSTKAEEKSGSKKGSNGTDGVFLRPGVVTR